MKKILFSFLCLLGFVGLVNAKPQIEYDWGEYIPAREFIAAGEINDNIAIFTYYENGSKVYVLYDKDGNVLFQKYNLPKDLNGYFYIVNDQIIYLEFLSNDICYQAIFDQEFKLINDNEVSGCSFFDEDSVAGETDKYYYIGKNIFYKSNNEIVNIGEYLENHELYPQYLNYKNENNYSNMNEVLFNVYKDEFKGTQLPGLYYFETLDDYYLVNFYVNEKGEHAVIYWCYSTYNYVLKMYNDDYNEVASFTLDSLNMPYVVIKNDYAYVVEVINKNVRSDLIDDYSLKTTLSQYDLEGNKIYSIDLNNISDCKQCFDDYFEHRRIFSFIDSKDGIYLLTEKKYLEKGMDTTIDDGDEITGIYPTIQKFSLVYEVETKKNENGTIKVDKGSSKNGDKITYIVEPKDGYKLDKVIVTDVYGNTIEIKDSSFTMPNSNVTIEAIFVVENPNTSVFIRIGIFVVIMLLTYYFVILQNIKVRKFE